MPTTLHVLTHIIDATRAKRCGVDRWMGHGICHGSTRNRDLSIRDTGSRILLHDFTGCPLSSICTALGIRVADLFDNAPLLRVFRPIQRPPRRPDRRQIAFQLELHGIVLQERAERTLAAAGGLDTSEWSDADFDMAMAAITRAYENLAHAHRLFDLADGLRETAFLEDHRHGAI